MLKEAYQNGVHAAIKEAQDQGLLGKVTTWADKNPSIAAGLFSRPLLNAMQTMQEIDPEAEQLRHLLTVRPEAPIAATPVTMPTMV